MASGPDAALRGAKKKDAFFRKVEEGIQTFSLSDATGAIDGARTNYRLSKGDILRATVQVLPVGFANSLHYHPAYEGFWMVLEGRVRFYGADDALIGDFGPHEGVFVPRNGRYRFAQAGEAPAYLLQLRGDAREGAKGRVDIARRHAGYGQKQLRDISD